MYSCSNCNTTVTATPVQTDRVASTCWELAEIKIKVRSEYKENLLKFLMILKTYQISQSCSVDLGLVCSEILS